MRTVFGLFTATVVCCLLFAGAPRAAALSSSVQKAYSGISTMRAEFSQTLVHKESGSREQRGGVLMFKKPLLVRWETQTPAPELLLVGRDAIWNAFPDEEITYKYALALAEDSSSIIRVVTGQAKLDQDFDLEEGKEGGLLTVRLYPKEPTQAMVEALLWIDPQTYLLKKLRIYDFFGNENEIVFSKQTIGAVIDDAAFSYAPPQGFLVEDRSKDSGAALKKPLLQ